jgi:hypothetical protein
VELQPYQQRVVAERDELQTKINALGAFIASNLTFAMLPDEERSRLYRQHRHMTDYCAVLSERIAAFE